MPVSAAFLAQLASSSLEEDNRERLWCVLLLARQAALEGTQIFPSYAIWFKVSVALFVIQHVTVTKVAMATI